MKWYKIRARDMRVHKPDGFVLMFWLWSKDETHVRERCRELGIINIEYVTEDEGPDHGET